MIVLGGTVHLPLGLVRQAAVVIVDDRIASVGEAPPGCAEIDARGKTITAGLVDPHTSLGLVEIGAEDGSDDRDAQGDPIRAGLRVWEGYNPAASAVGVTRIAGVTSAIVAPSGGLLAGRSAFVSLGGARQDDAIVRTDLGVYASLGATATRPNDLALLREFFDEARVWTANRAAWQSGAVRVDGVSPQDLEAVQPVLSGRVPLVVRADRAADIEALLRFGSEQKIRLVIEGAAEGWKVADLLAESRTPVVVDPLVYGAGSFDQIAGRPDNAALLAKGGVQVMISTFHSHNVRNLPQLAGNAVRGGMAHKDALLAITEVPADVFGLAGYGRIAPGAVADLVVWSGDPLELSSRPERVFISGREIPLVSRQTKLLEKYRTLPGVSDQTGIQETK